MFFSAAAEKYSTQFTVLPSFHCSRALLFTLALEDVDMAAVAGDRKGFRTVTFGGEVKQLGRFKGNPTTGGMEEVKGAIVL